MKLVFNVEDRPEFSKTIVFAFQQLLAIMAATIAVPAITGHGMSMAAALFGAGVGTLVYVLFTRAKSPVFLGSSFAFLGSMSAAFGGAASMEAGYAGLIIGAILAGLVYVVISLIIRAVGIDWINKLMPAVVIGPTVAIIGLSLAGNAVSDLSQTNVTKETSLWAILCGVVTLLVVTLCSTYGKKMAKLIPFVIGIAAGYALAIILTLIGDAAGVTSMQIVDFSPIKALAADGVTLKTFLSAPSFTFMVAKNGLKDIDLAYIGTVAVAYIPVAFVVFAEHVADHKNISTIIERDLLTEPGLKNTLLGDGVGSMVGAFFGGCPNTTYGESIACVAITGNASIVSIISAAFLAIIVSFLSPITAILSAIPSCVMGGVCMALYGFIAVSGLKMMKDVDLNVNRNLFVVSVILIAGIGGLSLNFGKVTITAVATALILGIIVNNILAGEGKNK